MRERARVREREWVRDSEREREKVRVKVRERVRACSSYSMRLLVRRWGCRRGWGLVGSHSICLRRWG